MGGRGTPLARAGPPQRRRRRLGAGQSCSSGAPRPSLARSLGRRCLGPPPRLPWPAAAYARRGRRRRRPSLPAAPGRRARGSLPGPPGAAMSHVRLSNGSPTLERMEGRQADHPKPSACRSLFGPVDHDELARELQRHRRDLAEASRRKWNFDFQRHQPLDGRYEWRALAPGALPDFYSRPPRLRRAPAQPDGGGGGSDSSRRSHGRAAEETPRTDAAAPAELGAGPRKRPADPDDSSHQNKRANSTEVIPEDSPCASSVEQTPKKSSPGRHQT
ncbi:UNVERIFIED_CONTAM: hypothetical protein K2H54_022904 [Gekko kuhli]